MIKQICGVCSHVHVGKLVCGYSTGKEHVSLCREEAYDILRGRKP